jgi:hypothetical protein
MKKCVAVMLLIAAGLLSAQAGTAKLAGKGELFADGNGAAMLRGSGTMKIEGQGTLWYKGDGELITSGDVARETVGEWTLILNFNGSAEAKGTDLRLSLSGKNIKVNAVGTGKAMFWGKGTFSAHRRSGTWDVKWTVIPYTEGLKKKEKTKATDTQGS